MTIKQTIIKEMQCRGDKMSSLAKNIGVSYPTIYNFIKKDKGISLSVLETICKYYGLELVKMY